MSAGTRRVLQISATIEAATGAALIAAPALVLRLLFDADGDSTSLTVSRVAGIALLALALGAFPGGTAARRAMLLYNAAVGTYLAWLGVSGAATGVLLWPAAGLHLAIAVLLTPREKRA